MGIGCGLDKTLLQKPHTPPEPQCRIPCDMTANKRLKLAGGDRSKGSGALCPGAHELSFNYTAPGGHVARS